MIVFASPELESPTALREPDSDLDHAKGRRADRIVDTFGGEVDWVVGVIAHPAPPIEHSLPARTVATIFESDPDLFALAVVKPEGGFGLIDRASLMAYFARRFGRELFEKKAISLLMDKAPLVVDARDEATTVSARIATDYQHALSNGFVITEKGRYLGVASGIDLLRLQAGQLVRTLATLNEAQEDLVQAEKMASLGQLVAGVAHEINTPIGVGLTAASHLSEATAKFDRLFTDQKLKRSDLEHYVNVATESADMIQANIERAAQLIQSFKKVAIDQTSGERRRFEMAALLEDVLASLRPEFKHSAIKITSDCPPDLIADSYPGALTQIFTNLVMNALIHAFEAGQPGTLSIAIARSAGGDEAIITVRDDGKGIPPEHRPKIFDPFFTTRRGLGGSGLGLHIVYNIVTATLKGRLSCRSRVGAGTSFHIRIPLILDGAPPSDQRK
jgi:signal transduction histidine kinase